MKPLFCSVCSDEICSNNHGTTDEPLCDICALELEDPNGPLLDEEEDENNS